MADLEIGARVFVHIDVPRGSFVKPRRGKRPFVSPLPCPFDYGEIVGLTALDGDAVDVIVFGRDGGPLDGEHRVCGVVRFVDKGVVDDKWIVGRPPTRAESRLLAVFFTTYAWFKRAARLGRGGRTAYLGLTCLGRSP